jgi:hypothetical protein
LLATGNGTHYSELLDLLVMGALTHDTPSIVENLSILVPLISFLNGRPPDALDGFLSASMNKKTQS